jgi:hypothetical protein
LSVQDALHSNGSSQDSIDKVNWVSRTHAKGVNDVDARERGPAIDDRKKNSEPFRRRHRPSDVEKSVETAELTSNPGNFYAALRPAASGWADKWND